jgi:hypothetical protein
VHLSTALDWSCQNAAGPPFRIFVPSVLVLAYQLALFEFSAPWLFYIVLLKVPPPTTSLMTSLMLGCDILAAFLFPVSHIIILRRVARPAHRSALLSHHGLPLAHINIAPRIFYNHIRNTAAAYIALTLFLVLYDVLST